MHVIKGRNVNELYYAGMEYLSECGEKSDSRAGEVLVSPVPVTSVYKRPRERVLFDAGRDANPFFHLFEGLWMLAGDDSANELDFYVKDFGARFAQTGNKIHGAYGARWRDLGTEDQLSVIVEKLRADQNDRQCVLQMWDNSKNIHKIDGVCFSVGGHEDLTGNWKDRPCNTHVYFRVRDGVLDMTICCRSNDIVWGAYGANAVHFSMLMEYMASRIGVHVGIMYQVSNNYHGYTNVISKMNVPPLVDEPMNWYRKNGYVPPAMGSDWEVWDSDLMRFMGWHRGFSNIIRYGRFSEVELSRKIRSARESPQYRNSWFLIPTNAALAYGMYKKKNIDLAIEIAGEIEALDWREACVAWLKRRIK